MNKRNKTLILNMVFFGLVTVLSKGVGYLLLPIFTSYMSTADYGIADLLVSTVNMLYPITALGMGAAILRFTASGIEDRKIVFSSALRVICFTSVIPVLFIPIIVKHTGIPEMYVWYVPLEMFFVNLVAILASLCKGINKTKYFLIQSVVKAGVLLLSAYVTLKIYNMGIVGYMLSYLLADVVSVIVFILSINISQYISLHIEKAIWLSYRNRLIKYGAPLVPNSMSAWVVQMSDRYMVAYWCGASVNGLYAVAYKIPSIIKVLTSTFISAWQLNVISEADKKDSEDYFNRVKGIYSATCFIVAGLILIFVRTLARVLFSKDFYEAWRFVPLLVLAMVLDLLAEYLGTYFFAKDRTGTLFFSTLLGAVVNIVLNLLLIPRYGAWGATIATVISTFSMYIHRGIVIKRTMGWKSFALRDTIGICLLGSLCIAYSVNALFGVVLSTSFTVLFIIAFIDELKIIIGVFARIIRKTLLGKEKE